MKNFQNYFLSDLEDHLIKRKKSLFQKEYSSQYEEIKTMLDNKVIIILGAAGTIGSLLSIYIINNFNFEKIFFIDKNENELVDLNRKINEIQKIVKVEYVCCDINSSIYKDFLKKIPVSNELIIFYACALKHVRSSENIYSLKNMFYTNFISVFDHFKLLKNKKLSKFIYISTDKAADPVSMMGLSKKLGELCITYFANESFKFVRFANILISNGNIFDSNLKRLRENRPLSWNRQIKRLFIRRDEAVHLILLSLNLNKFHGLVPNFSNKNQMNINNLMIKMLKYLGYTITKKHSRDDNNYIATHNKTSKKINLFLNSGIMNNEKFQETMTSKSEKKYKRKNLCLIKLKREDLIKLDDMRRFIIKPNFNELDFINLIKKTFKLSLNTNARKKLSDII